MSSITYQRLVGGLPVAADAVTLEDATDTYGILNNATAAVAVAAGTAVTEDEDTATYTYTTTALPAGSYTAVWKVVVGAVTTYVVHVFIIDAAESADGGVRLYKIEQEVAQMLGPYFLLESNGGGTNSIGSLSIQTTLTEQGGFEDLYILRRGRNADGTLIANFPADDRVRMVAATDLENGLLTPDRAWTLGPVDGEEFELHHLHPVRELRTCVQRGLARCYLMDSVSVVSSEAAVERNLTSLASWITTERQIRNLESTYPNQTTYLPRATGWWRTRAAGGSVLVSSARDPYPNPLRVTALRPASSLVNGATSLIGPDDDDDLIAVALDYATSAALVEAWKRFRPRVMPVSQTGLGLTLPEVTKWFTQLSRKYCHTHPSDMKFDAPLGYYGSQLP